MLFSSSAGHVIRPVAEVQASAVFARHHNSMTLVSGMPTMKITASKTFGVRRIDICDGVPLETALHGVRPQIWLKFRNDAGVQIDEGTMWALDCCEPAVAWARRHLEQVPVEQLQEHVTVMCGGFSHARTMAEDVLGVRVRWWTDFTQLSRAHILRLLDYRLQRQRGLRQRYEMMLMSRVFCEAEDFDLRCSQYLKLLPDGTFAAAAAPEDCVACDLMSGDLSWRIRARCVDGQWAAIILRDGVKTTVAADDRTLVRRFSDAGELQRYVKQHAKPAGLMFTHSSGANVPLIIPIMLSNTEVTLRSLALPSGAEGSDSGRAASTRTDAQLELAADGSLRRGMSRQQLLLARAHDAISRHTVEGLCGRAAAFSQRASVTECRTADVGIQAVEALTCLTVGGRFMHAGLPAQPHRLHARLTARRLFVPVNTYAPAVTRSTSD
jgi:hypothetical protein